MRVTGFILGNGCLTIIADQKAEISIKHRKNVAVMFFGRVRLCAEIVVIKNNTNPVFVSVFVLFPFGGALVT